MLRWLFLLGCASLAAAQVHPRLIFRPPNGSGPGRTFDEMRNLYRNDSFFRTVFDVALRGCATSKNPAALATCWIVSQDDRFAHSAAALLNEQNITSSGSGSYSDVWAFALAWDWLYDHPALSGKIRERAANRIAERLASELSQLDDRGMALWHGRNQAANGAMIAALALGGQSAQQEQLTRATAHYVEAIRALDYSEGWPEGPSYWIYNRALPYAIAADSYLTATGSSRAGGLDIRAVMRKIGLWTLYQYGPNGVFEPFGDSAGSLRLGETGIWEASSDYFARLSRDPGVMAGAFYLRERSPAPYGKGRVHWYAAIAYDPSARPGKGFDPERPDMWLRKHMPQTMLFGRRSLGVAFLRGNWGAPDELFASFKAGDLLAHHDHYNAGHFSIQLAGLLAPLTGVYGASSYSGAYRLGYAIQTVASNSLLVMAPDETSVALERLPQAPWTGLSGGQRVINPTGFDCVNVAHFEHQRKSGRLERADITAFESREGIGDYIAADLTAAYNSTRYAEPRRPAKVSLVTRQFVFLRKERAFVVFDRVETTRPEFAPKFLLHAIAKPQTETETLLTGLDANDGILQTSDRLVRIRGEGGVLTQRILLPQQAKTRKIGGMHYSGYVEPSGSHNDGMNLEPDPGKGGASAKPKGLWRLEVEPAVTATSNRFLNVLLPALAAEQRQPPETELLDAGSDVVAVRVGKTAVVMARDDTKLDRVEFQSPSDLECWIVDARPGGVYTFGGKKVSASAEGVLVLRWQRGKRVLRR
jgi:hypothetical protein